MAGAAFEMSDTGMGIEVWAPIPSGLFKWKLGFVIATAVSFAIQI